MHFPPRLPQLRRYRGSFDSARGRSNHDGKKTRGNIYERWANYSTDPFTARSQRKKRRERMETRREKEERGGRGGKKDVDAKEGNTLSNIKARGGLGTANGEPDSACVGLLPSRTAAIPSHVHVRDTTIHANANQSTRNVFIYTGARHQTPRRFVFLSARFVFRRGLMRFQGQGRSPRARGRAWKREIEIVATE